METIAQILAGTKPQTEQEPRRPSPDSKWQTAEPADEPTEVARLCTVSFRKPTKPSNRSP